VREDVEAVCKTWTSYTAKRKQEVDKKREDMRVCNNEYAQLVGRENELKGEMERLRKEKDVLSGQASIKDLVAQLSSVDNDVGNLEKQLVQDFEDVSATQMFVGAKKYLERNMTRVEMDGRCPMCKQDVAGVETTPEIHMERVIEDRDLGSKVYVFDPAAPCKGVKAVQANIARVIENIDVTAQKQSQALVAAKNALDAFRRDLPKFQKLQGLGERIEELQGRIQTQNEKKEDVSMRSGALKKECGDMEARLSELVRVERELADCLRSARECERSEDLVEQETCNKVLRRPPPPFPPWTRHAPSCTN
jgi:DNA repair exonuclease SbcCD ATPase subunit